MTYMLQKGVNWYDIYVAKRCKYIWKENIYQN